LIWKLEKATKTGSQIAREGGLHCRCADLVKKGEVKGVWKFAQGGSRGISKRGRFPTGNRGERKKKGSLGSDYMAGTLAVNRGMM